jgi:DNA-binding transcriptional ArsR family regulator
VTAALDVTLSALAEPSRRQVVDLLGRGPLRASEVADALGASRPATSRHLRVLREAGLVTEERAATDGRGRVYTLRAEPLRDLRGWLSEVEAFWTDQLGAFAALVDEEAP